MSGSFSLSSFDWALCAAYFAGIFTLAWRSGRKHRSTVTQYFMAGDSIPWFAVGASMIASTLSTEQMMGENGASYKYGFAIAQWDCYTLPPVTMLVWIFLPIYLRRKVVTIPEYLAQRYGPVLRDAFSVIAVVSYPLVFLAVVLYSGSLLISSLFPLKIMIAGLDCTILVWSAALMFSTAVYTIWGGLAAVVWTDLIQFLILSAAGLMIFVFSMKIISGESGIHFLWHGWQTLRTAQHDRFHLILPANHPLIPWPALFMRVVTTQLYYNCANQFIVQRALAAKSDWDARMGALTYAAVGFVLPFVDVLPGMIAYQLNPHLPDANRVVPFVLRSVIPSGWGVRGFIMAGLLAAVMSTPSSLINSTSTIFTLDIYKRRLNPNASNQQLLQVGRIACLVTALCAVLWAPLVGNYPLIFTYFQSFVAYIAAPSGAIFLLGVFWRRATEKAALAALIFGLGFCLSIEILKHLFSDVQLPWPRISLGNISFIYVSFAGWVLSMMIMVLVSYADRPPDYDKVKGLLWSRDALRQPRSLQSGGAWYRSLAFWYLAFVAVWVVFIARFL
jgi:solute:Na+ symporter, SSS family